MTFITTYDYDAWGKLLSIKDASGNLITDSDSFAVINPIRYRGYYYDTESGLYYLQSRYYDPTTGRFLNADSVEYLGTNGSTIGYNLFTYCDNNSVNNVDINGHSTESIILNVASIILSFAMLFTPWMKIKVAIGVVVGLASLYITYRDYNNQIRKLTKLYNERKITYSQYIQKKRNAEYWKNLGLVAAGITLVCSVLSWPGTKIINSVGYSVINALGFAKGVVISKTCLINDLIDAMNHRPRYS